ncbi:MAG: RIP metalloprotease RseP [Bdellovibrionota bacterium]
MFSNVLIPILLFGILVFIHELGHFSVAKWSGVFVERFSIGFGPAIFRKKWGETEYALCLLPLGGYVKMRGEETIESEDAPHTNDPRSFDNQNVWTRIAIAIMGPVFNLVLPVILFTFLFLVGIPKISTQLGYTDPSQVAWQAGLRPGDRITSIQGQPVTFWDDLSDIIQKRGGLETTIDFIRNGKPMSISLTPAMSPGRNAYGEEVPVGKLGISPQEFLPAIAVTQQDTALMEKGFASGDVITSINGKKISHWWQVQDLASQEAISEMEVLRDDQTTLKATFENAQDIQLRPLELMVSQSTPSESTPALIQSGDYVLRIDGAPISSWFDVQTQVQENQGQPMILSVLREEQEIELTITPEEKTYKDPITKEKKLVRQLGIGSMAKFAQVDTTNDQTSNLFVAMVRGTQESWNITRDTVIGMGKLFAGKVSVNSLGGPISIFSMASTSYKNGGWVSFFRLMAILSITLGVLNLLPVPVLDGGHLLFYFIEALKGSPVHIKVRQWAQQIGVVMVLGLMALVFYVDINRFFVDRIKDFFQ